ncbi:MAG: MMPL family transporter [Bacteroidia bacterium]|nr:MMPL family transporter [Bacteroidia bacterium]
MKEKNIFVIRYRWHIIIATILIVGLSIIPIMNISINSDLESYMPDSMLSKKQSKLIQEEFGDDELLMILIEAEDVLQSNTLQRIKDISESFSQEPTFKRVFSLFQAKNIRSEEGMMIVDPVVPYIPESEPEREALREEIRKNDLAYELVVSESFKHALIVLTSDTSLPDDKLMDKVQEVIEKYPGDEKVYITGQPYLRDEANQKISRDLMFLLPLGLLIMFIFFWLSFRELRGVFLPFSVVVFSILVSMALIPLFGWELSLIGVLIPIMMIAIANNYGVHFIAKYQEINVVNPDWSMRKIIEDSTKYLTMPVLLCGLTTIVGILGLVAHLLLPASQMGVITAIGISFALIISLMYVPAVLSLMKKGKPHKELLLESNRGFFRHLLSWAGNLVTAHPKRTLWFFIVFLALATLGFIRFKVAADSYEVLPQNHSFNQAIAIADKHFGGDKIINIMYEGDVKDPEFLRNLEYFKSELKKIPNVGSVTSLATLIRKMSTALNDYGDAAYDQIPDTPEGVAQYLELYAMSGDPDDYEQFVNFDYTKTLVTIQYHASKISEINTIVNKIDQLAQEKEMKYVLGGHSLIDKEISQSTVTGQYYSLLVAFIAIIILLAIIFKSFTAGLLGSIPLVFAVLCTFGLMGWLGIKLNIVTALLSSISIGLGVDYTIHIFWRLKFDLKNQPDYISSVKQTLKTIGRGISINAFSVMIGFSVLFLSAFPLIQSFALLIILSLLLCLICALLLIPALCYLIKPKFLYK